MISSSTCEVQEGRAPKNQEVLRQTLSICQAGTGQEIFHSFPRQVSHTTWMIPVSTRWIFLFVQPLCIEALQSVHPSSLKQAAWHCDVRCTVIQHHFSWENFLTGVLRWIQWCYTRGFAGNAHQGGFVRRKLTLVHDASETTELNC